MDEHYMILSKSCVNQDCKTCNTTIAQVDEWIEHRAKVILLEVQARKLEKEQS